MTVVAISCGDDVEDPVIYTVTVMTAEGGEADASCYEVIAGEEVTLIATPESGYIFKCWMLNGVEVSRENPYTTVVNKNTVYVAKFVKEGEGGTEDGENNEGENNEDEPNQIETFDVLSEIEKDEMVFVKGSSFKMGATSEQTEDAKADESPVHLVILSDYYISRYEVTQKFWETIMGTNPSSTKGDDLPVDNVSWEECQQFIKKLNEKTGKRYSLPTEAEWEYAARGGEKTENHKFSGSNTASEVAWSDAIDGTIEAVGTKKYNELGIYDMSGNVSELCYNYYESYTTDDQVNPIGKTIGDKRVVRGGNISSASLNCRVGTRTTISQTEKQAKIGFRIVLSKPTYEVSVKPSSEERGSVTIAGTTQTQYIREGGEVTLTATAKENCNFHNWTANGEEVSKEATCTITVTKDAEYTANFITHKVTVIAGEGGTAEASKTQVEDNEKITLTATPKEGYSFVNWTVNGEEVSKEATYTATITADTEFKANFISYKITVIASEGGTATASKTQVGHNAQVTLTATPQEGYSFVNWTVNGEEVSKDATYTATITADTEFKANFISYKITVIASEGGTATASKTQVGHNAQVTLTATPQEGYSFVNWTVNGEEVSKDAIYTATITEDIEIKANFISYKITVISGEGGTATASKTQVGHNAQVTLTATPQDGYYFVNWTVNGEEVSKETTYTATITEDIEIKANFAKCKKITVLTSEGGTAEASKTQVEDNEKITLTATPKEGYSFVNWTVNGEEVSKEATYTATITADTEFKANFISYKITVIAGEGGTAKANKTQVGHNAQVTLTATPQDGYYFVNWTVNGEEVSTQATYTSVIKVDTEFVANFKYCGYVDLGLPSGIKWATCNVGAETPEEYGDYFAWGETEPKDYYYWDTYKYYNGSYDTMTKYSTKDYKTTLELSDDAARVNWGGAWRMPTKAEQKELRNSFNCSWKWTTQNGVKGYKVTSKKNGNSIFLPAAGSHDYYGFSGAGSYGNYWSSSLYTSYRTSAYNLDFNSSDVDWDGGYGRYYGFSVRAVCP